MKKKPTKRASLSKEDWAKVFAARCHSKQGRPISEKEQELIEVAFKSDAKRYRAMERDVFNATTPFGSAAKWK